MIRFRKNKNILDRVIDVRRGDIVILRCDGRLTKSETEKIIDQVKYVEGSGIKFILLDKSMNVEHVLRLESEEHEERETVTGHL